MKVDFLYIIFLIKYIPQYIYNVYIQLNISNIFNEILNINHYILNLKK